MCRIAPRVVVVELVLDDEREGEEVGGVREGLEDARR